MGVGRLPARPSRCRGRSRAHGRALLHVSRGCRLLLGGARVAGVAVLAAGRRRGPGFSSRPVLVVTSNRVIDGQTAVRLVANGARYTARVMSASPTVDVALLQVFGPNPQQPALRLGR